MGTRRLQIIHFPLASLADAHLALQRIIRVSPALHQSPIWKLTRGKKMTENFQITFSKPDCNHHELCGCLISVDGITPDTIDLKWVASGGTLSEQYSQFAAYANTVKAGISPDNRKFETQSEIEWFRTQLPLNSTVKPIPPPIKEDRSSWPTSVELFSVDLRVQNALRRADYRYCRHRFPHMHISWDLLKRQVWNYDSQEVPSLFALTLRNFSMVHWALGKTNGRPHVVSAMSHLYPRKFAKAILSVARQEVGDRPREPLKFVDEALNHLYRMMKIDMTKKDKTPFSLKPLEGMYLGASNGITSNQKYTIDASEEMPHDVKVSSKGKKVDTFEQDLNCILNFLRTGEPPPTYWYLPPKDENFFSFVKQMSDADWVSWQEKLRVFFIPSSPYILMERLVSRLRHVKERGWVIRVGHRHGHGGGDSLAKCLGVTEQNCFDPDIVEGDGKNFDQSVREFFVNLFFSTMNIHRLKDMSDYEIFEKLTRYLLANMITRVTKLFGDVWAIVKGGVPSGAFNTSHMDSWIMALYFVLFCVYQIHTAPVDLQEELEAHFIEQIMIIVYGDDHLYNKGKGNVREFFSGTAFAAFMKQHFDVEIRDLRDGIPFCSIEKDGFLILKGASFLKHYFVLNPERKNDPSQPTFLPYRETREVIIRAIYGRQTKPRDVIDTMLSVLGHVNANYASNRQAYDMLYLLYSELLRECESVENISNLMLNRLDNNDMKRIRQMGMEPSELVSGFPSWEKLVQKNVVDHVYQDISQVPFDFDESLVDDMDLDYY